MQTCIHIKFSGYISLTFHFCFDHSCTHFHHADRFLGTPRSVDIMHMSAYGQYHMFWRSQKILSKWVCCTPKTFYKFVSLWITGYGGSPAQNPMWYSPITSSMHGFSFSRMVSDRIHVAHLERDPFVLVTDSFTTFVCWYNSCHLPLSSRIS